MRAEIIVRGQKRMETGAQGGLRDMARRAEDQQPRLTVFQVIGFNIGRLAKERGWTDEALAVYSGVSRSTASKVIRGRAVQTEKQRAIMSALDAPWEEFVRPIPKDATPRVFLDGIPSASLELIQGSGKGRSRAAQSPLVSVVST